MVRLQKLIGFLGLIVAVCTFTAANALADVAVYGANNQTWNQEVRNKIAAASGGSLGAVDFFDATSVTPTLADLSGYSAVLVYSDSSFANAVALGDVLADYVDAGGSVVFATFAYNIGPIGGRIVTGGYLPVTLGGQTNGSGLTLVPVDAGSPLLAGVSSFNGGTSSYHNVITLTAGSTLVAEWSNGRPLIAVRGSVIALNFYPPSTDSRGDFWVASTDGALMMANALGYAGGPITPPPAPPPPPGATPVPVLPLWALMLMMSMVGILGLGQLNRGRQRL